MKATTRKIELPDDGVETFFGTHDENLRHLEHLFGVEIRTDGHGLLVDGDSSGADRVERFVQQVAGLMKDGYKFGQGEVKTAASLIAEDPGVDLRDHFLRSTVRASTVSRRRLDARSMRSTLTLRLTM